MRMHTLSLISPLLLLAALAAQNPVLPQPAPQDVLAKFQIKDGTIQDLTLPVDASQPLQLRVALGGVVRTLDLAPCDVRTPGFRLLVDDGRTLQELARPSSVTMRGTVLGAPESVVAASCYEGRLSAYVRTSPGVIWGIEAVDTQVPGVPRTSHLVFRDQDVTLRDVRCGGHPLAPNLAHGTGAGNGGGAPAAMKVCEIACDADFEYYGRYGSNAVTVQNQVTSVINAVAAIYKADVEIDYKITTILVRTTAIYAGTTDMGTRLTQFQNYWNANHGAIVRDTAHCFTGIGTFSGVIGIAYLSVICSTGSAYGVSKCYSTSLTTNAGLCAHELGHNWSAPHCDGLNPCWIMCSGLGGCGGVLTSFGSVSAATILSFKGTRSCLSDPPPSGPPILSTITPNTVTSWLPAEITATGQRLDLITKLTLGGVDFTGFTVVNANMIKFKTPAPSVIATAPLTATNASGVSNPLNLTVLGNHASIIEIPVVALRGFALPYKAHTDRNWNALFFVSLSNIPSILPNVVSLGLGNAFTSLYDVGTFPADTTGTAQFSLTIPLSVPANATFYWQAITYDPMNITLPLEVSDLRAHTTI